MLAELTMYYDGRIVRPCDGRTVFRANELITLYLMGLV